MCYSAEVEADWRKFLYVTGADMSLKDFFDTFWKRRSGLPFRMPKMMDRCVEGMAGDEAAAIRSMIADYNAAQVTHWEREAFRNRKRVVDAERTLQAAPTRKAENDQRIGSNKLKQALRKLDELQRSQSEPGDGRFFPGWYVPVVIVENGRRVVKPMRYQLRRVGNPASDDTRYPGCYNARRDNLEKFWKGQFGHTHGITLANRFWENVDRDGANAVLEFWPNTHADMLVACLYSHWVSADGSDELWSFAAVTDDPPPEIAAAGHDRCIIPIKAQHVEAWLNPEASNLAAQYAILDDRERPFYAHRLAA